MTGVLLRDLRFPLSGQPVPVRIDGRTLYSWWGQDRHGDDCLATRGGRLVVADSETGIQSEAESHGWEATGRGVPGEHVAGGDDDAVVIDVDEVKGWLSHRGRAVPVAAALDVWNLAIDVAHSCRRVRADRGYWVDRAHDKLFAANVPWFFGRTSYRPRWTRQDLTALRRIEGDALGLLRTSFTGS